MHPGQHRLVAADVAVHQGEVLGAVDRGAVAVRREVAVPGRQPGLGDPLDQVLGAVAVPDQVVDRDHRQVVLVGERAQLRRALHRAVVVDDLDQDADRGQPRQPGQVDGRLGVAAPAEHAALAVAQREHVPGPGDLPGLGGRVGEHPGGVRAVPGADPRADAVAGVHRDRELRPHPVAVVRRHQGDLEPVEHLRRHRDADHPGAVPDGERHQLGGRLGGGEDDVALVLPLLVVDHHHRLPGCDVGDRAFDAVQMDAHTSASSSCGCSRREARNQTTNPQITRAPYTT